jgi:hypothetical protein
MTVPFFERGDPVCDILFDDTTRAQSAGDRDFNEGPIEVLPGLMSHDPRLLAFKDWLSKEATKRFPSQVDSLGRVFGNGVRGNFYGIRHINGLPMLPATWPLADNSLKREKAELKDHYTEDWHEKLFRSFVRLVFTNMTPVPLKIRKGSSTCIPYFSTTMSVKIALAKRHLQEAEAAGKLMMEGKFKEAFEQYQFGGAYYVVYRSQSTDKVDFENGDWKAKDRYVADRANALSGGKEGSEFAARKLINEEDRANHKIEGSVKGFFRERRRTAMGGPWAINASLAPIMQAVRKRLYSVYEYSFHHTTRLNKEEKIRDWKIAIAADVSDHDMNFPRHIIGTMMDELREMGFADWWVKIFETSLQLPVYVSSPAPGEGKTLIGDWREPNINVGLSSGNAATDIMGTYNMSVTYAIVQIEQTMPELIKFFKGATQLQVDTWFDSYLKGELNICQMSKSDDALLGWKDNVGAARAETLLNDLVDEKPVSPYNKVGYEHGGAFLGDILLYGQDKQLKNVIAIGNIMSFLTNQFSPEYSVQSQIKDRTKVKRPFPMLAWETIGQVYGQCPVYAEMLELIEDGWWKFFGESYSDYRAEGLRKDKLELAKYTQSMRDKMDSGLSLIEYEVMSDPNKLSYKYDETDVSKDIVDLFMNAVPLEYVEPFFNSVVPGDKHVFK